MSVRGQFMQAFGDNSGVSLTLAPVSAADDLQPAVAGGSASGGCCFNNASQRSIFSRARMAAR